MKSFFSYYKYSSVSYMLLKLGLPSFNTVMFNCSFNFQRNLLTCDNLLVSGMLT